MDFKNRSLELLAPAGDREALLAAVAAGADAVYLGGKLFNARRSATNFDGEQLRTAVELLHLHNKKLYVTVNTLIRDDELNAALDYLAELYNLGVDAVIVQDLGLIKLSREYLPDLELHASTQMTVHNTDGARFLKEMGLKRVVLAREMTKEDVTEIIAKSGMEVEVFVHGALCVCYSGQCLLSSMIGGRSGNRGRCAQPCRMEYQFIRNGQPQITTGTYLLSPKDLSLVTLIPDLDRAGVASLKIEGRMKRPEYVYTVVRNYRRVLDRYYENPEKFRVEPEEIRELEESFNRGFSTGYFGNNRNASLMSFNRPNNRGVFLGRVLMADHAERRISIKLEADLETGDGIEVWVSRGGRGAGTVKEIFVNGEIVQAAKAGTTVSLPVNGKAYSGDRVFKVFSNQLYQQTKQAVDLDNPDLKTGCDVLVRGREGHPLEITYRDPAGNEGTASTGAFLEVARNKPLTEEALREHLGRLGNTAYYLNEMTVQLPQGLMVPFSDLNQVRREAIEILQQNKLARYRRQPVKLPQTRDIPGAMRRPGKEHRLPVLSVWAGDLDSVKEAVRAGAAIVYVGGDELTAFRWTEDCLREAVAVAEAGGARLIMGMPRINTDSQRDLWFYYYRMLTEISTDGIIVSDLGLLSMVLREDLQPVFLNYPLNFFNSCALQAVQHPRVEQIAVSPELTLKQISELSAPAKGICLEAVVHGPLELMVSEYCPVNSLNPGGERCQKVCKTGSFALRDRMNLDFPVYTDQFCRMHLLNSKDHCLYGDLDKLVRSGLDVLRLELKTYPAEQVGWITRIYHQALDNLVAGSVPDDADGVIEEFKNRSGRGITKGHYFRGVD
ncbi:MAG TPA: U32 family peptidase [Bacillota bacterium]|nr:U32 family peptidase [Bacillota bacterium]